MKKTPRKFVKSGQENGEQGATALKIQQEVEQLFKNAPDYLQEDIELLEAILRARMRHYQITEGFTKKISKNIQRWSKSYWTNRVFHSIDEAVIYFLGNIYDSILDKPKHWNKIRFNYIHGRALTTEKKWDMLKESGAFQLRIIYHYEGEGEQEQRTGRMQKVSYDIDSLLINAAEHLKKDEALIEAILHQRINHYHLGKKFKPQIFAQFRNLIPSCKKKYRITFENWDDAFQFFVENIFGTIEKKTDFLRDAHYDFTKGRSITSDRKIRVLMEYSSSFKFQVYYNEGNLKVF